MVNLSKKYNICLLVLCVFTLAVRVQAGEVVLAPARLDLSFRNEIQHSIDRGLAWLTTNQNASGWWSTEEHPAMAALALSAFMGAPERRYRTNPPPVITRGYAYIVDSAKPDGSIYRTALKNYNTAISVTALVMANNPAYEPILRRGRAYLIGSQNDFGEPGKMDDPLDGGVGYGDKYKHADMNNMLFALEAIRATDYLVKDKNLADAKDLNWNAAIQFLQNCQNLPSHNAQEWVSKDPKDKGGFVYFPGHSMAGGVTNPVTGAVALRSYGSISYAGLMSYLYADLKKEDARVAAVFDWLRSNYTLQENPGMGQEGFYYYLHLMTKALSAAGVDTLELKDGSKVDWRRAVAMRLLNLQRPDGSWFNDNNRWWEKDPNLVTSYAVMALELIWWNGQPSAAQL
jgi:squalene-hopene/tetraprenyl-beta-curcumene cyclase